MIEKKENGFYFFELESTDKKISSENAIIGIDIDLNLYNVYGNQISKIKDLNINEINEICDYVIKRFEKLKNKN